MSKSKNQAMNGANSSNFNYEQEFMKLSKEKAKIDAEIKCIKKAIDEYKKEQRDIEEDKKYDKDLKKKKE